MRLIKVAGILVSVWIGSLATAAAQQPEKVIIVSGTPNASVIRVTINGSSSSTEVLDTNVKSPTGVVLDGDDAIVTYFDGVARYRNALKAAGPIAAEPIAALSKADGPSIDPRTGDLYVLAQFAEHTKLVRLARDGQGFGAPEIISGQLKSPQDTVVVESSPFNNPSEGPVRGDVLVVVASPEPGILRFDASSNETRFVELPGTKPTGIALSIGNGAPELLVSDEMSGIVWRVDFFGNQQVLSNTFLTGLSKVESTLAGSDFVAYATREAELVRYVVGNAPSAPQQFSLAGVSFTDGIGAVHVAPTLAGQNVDVAPAYGIELLFQNVELAGLTGAGISFFTLDGAPAAGGQGNGKGNGPKKGSTECVLVLESGNCVEDGIEPPLDGDPRIPLVQLDTTAAFGQTVLVRGDEDAVLGGHGHGAETRTDWTDELVRWLYAPEVRAGEHPIVECFDTTTASGGCTFLDVTIGYGSHYSRGFDFSQWIMAKDNRLGSEAARLERKASSLQAFLDGTAKTLGCRGRSRNGECDAVRALGSLLAEFLRAFRQGDYGAANQIMESFLAATSDLPGASGDNLAGQAQVRGLGLKFSNCTLAVQDGTAYTLEGFEQAINVCVGDPDVLNP